MPQHAAGSGPPGSGAAGVSPAAGAAGPDSALHIEWLELDAELPYNKNRAGIMHSRPAEVLPVGIGDPWGRSINDDDGERVGSVHPKGIRIIQIQQ